jgi:hypothetical protein
VSRHRVARTSHHPGDRLDRHPLRPGATGGSPPSPPAKVLAAKER